MSWMLQDIGYASYFLGISLISFFLHYLIWAFIWGKPEGRKTVIANIYLKTSYACLSLSCSGTIPYLMRVIFGPFPGEYVNNDIFNNLFHPTRYDIAFGG